MSIIATREWDQPPTPWTPTSTVGAGPLIAESGIVESHAGPYGTDVRMVGHVHPWGWK